jgi:hypothetical protein
MCAKKKDWNWEKSHEDSIIHKDDSVHRESYQPTEDSLDDNDPPGGGSGVPDKKDD